MAKLIFFTLTLLSLISYTLQVDPVTVDGMVMETFEKDKMLSCVQIVTKKNQMDFVRKFFRIKNLNKSKKYSKNFKFTFFLCNYLTISDRK